MFETDKSKQETLKLDHFGFLRVSGVDAVKFLQGYTTCDLDALDSNTVQMGAMCNLKGRMLTSFLVVREGSDLILRMHRSLIPKTVEFLTKYIVFSKAKLSDISEERYCFGLIGASDINGVSRSDEDYIVALGNRTEIWSTRLLEAQTDRDHDWNEAEITAGVAWVNSATTEEYLPQMFNYQSLGAIDFEKGCYLGQEIVARLHYRGELKQRLYCADIALSDNSDDWAVISTGRKSALLITQNQGEEPVVLKTGSGEQFIAEPL